MAISRGDCYKKRIESALTGSGCGSETKTWLAQTSTRTMDCLPTALLRLGEGARHLRIVVVKYIVQQKGRPFCWAQPFEHYQEPRRKLTGELELRFR